jgi:hypothetical protein
LPVWVQARRTSNSTLSCPQWGQGVGCVTRRGRRPGISVTAGRPHCTPDRAAGCSSRTAGRTRRPSSRPSQSPIRAHTRRSRLGQPIVVAEDGAPTQGTARNAPVEEDGEEHDYPRSRRCPPASLDTAGTSTVKRSTDSGPHLGPAVMTGIMPQPPQCGARPRGTCRAVPVPARRSCCRDPRGCSRGLGLVRRHRWFRCRRRGRGRGLVAIRCRCGSRRGGCRRCRGSRRTSTRWW